MSEKSVIDAVSVDNIRKHVEHIVTNIPSRLAGSENARRMAEYSAETLRQAGVESQVYPIPAIVSFPGPAEMRVEAPTAIAIQANTLGHSLATLDDGIAAELVYVGSGSYKDYENKNVVGRITLSELSYSPARHEKQRIATEKGAIGAVMMNWGHDENTALPWGSVKPAWGVPTADTIKTEMPGIPCIGIARTAGLELKRLCERGPVRVWLRTHVENGWRPVHLTVGRLQAPHGREFVVVGGHQDSWVGQAATDNAAGNACIMELARVFSAHRNELRRGLDFAFWTAHETGTMAGSAWYVDREWERLRENAIGYLLIDQPACIGTSRWLTRSNMEMKRFHQAIEQRLLNGRPNDWRAQQKGGDASFLGLGVPMMYGMTGYTEDELKKTADATFGWWHHSDQCNIDKLDWTLMAEHIRIYAAYLWELCTAPVIPFYFEGVAKQFCVRLETLCKLDGVEALDLNGTLGRAQTLQTAAMRLDQLIDQWSEHYRAHNDAAEAPADRLNRCIKRLSRLLLPIQSTAKGTYGHDPYGYTSQTTMIPCLYDVPRLAKMPRENEERWMLETQLVRDRNRVTDALSDACALIDDTLAAVGAPKK